MEGYINLDRGPFYNKGISPRQRRVFLLRWNPSISSFFLTISKMNLHNSKVLSHLIPSTLGTNWSVGIGKRVCTDVFRYDDGWAENIMVLLGAFFDGYPYQYEDENGNPLKSVSLRDRCYVYAVWYLISSHKLSFMPAKAAAKRFLKYIGFMDIQEKFYQVECAEKTRFVSCR